MINKFRIKILNFRQFLDETDKIFFDKRAKLINFWTTVELECF